MSGGIVQCMTHPSPDRPSLRLFSLFIRLRQKQRCSRHDGLLQAAVFDPSGVKQAESNPHNVITLLRFTLIIKLLLRAELYWLVLAKNWFRSVHDAVVNCLGMIDF